MQITKWLTALMAVSVLGTAQADETEIFRSQFSGSTARPKVLIIFDNSGSMRTTVPNSRELYDPSITYPTMPGIVAGRLYWSTDANGLPPPTNTNNWFDTSLNRCGQSIAALNNTGFYNGSQFARWTGSSWTNGLPTNNTERNATQHIDCRADITSNNPNNPGHSVSGYPRNINPRPYGANKDSSSFNNNFGGTANVRLYTANYMNYYHNPAIPKTDQTRLDIAKSVISNVVNSSPDVDFGLMTFNRNWDGEDGGRVVQRIIPNMTAADRTDLITAINSVGPDTNTPLCEAMWEAYLYLTGRQPRWGNITTPPNPVKDSLAQSNGRYVSPLSDCQYVYIIYMTDGEPSLDTAANTLVEDLTGKTCRSWQSLNYNNRTGWTSANIKNCLPELAEYMANNDLDGNPANGIQRALTYTIGFAIDHPMLKETAALGGGKYYTADNAEQLTAAFQGAITSILSANTTFTSPTVSIDTSNRVESRNEAFFALFKPQEGPNWPGNIKKLKIEWNATTGQLTFKDRNDADAIDSVSQSIASHASTFWNTVTDGPNVEEGGVGQKLRDMNPNSRVIKTNTGTNGALQDFNASNTFGFSNPADRYAFFGVNSQEAFEDLIAWARGWTDRSQSTRRSWIMGDMLHSRPTVLDYGARSGFTVSNPDLRIVAGTNAGFLHMFKNTDSATTEAGGGEVWAFFPKELGPILLSRRTNTAGAAHVYGIDGPMTVWRHDAPETGKPNGSGVIGDNTNDRMMLYFGLRRGGRSLYALDLINPDTPSLKWHISHETPGFSELGQTWSKPQLTYVPGYTDANGKPKAVLIFGGGYDPLYDSRSTVAASLTATQGRAIYIVDAETGALVWSASPAATNATNLQAPLRHPIAAEVTVVDGNGDGLTSIIYAADVGGHIWRIDLGSATPSNWVINQVARVSGNTHVDDRRFFNAVDVSRTRRDNRPFFALAIGSGDRTNPNATDNLDRFYVFHDRQITPFRTANPTIEECHPVNGSRRDDVRCSWPIKEVDLYDATNNIIQMGDEAQRLIATTLLNNRQGWYFNLSAAQGEKALSKAVTLGGRVYFTTFSPDPNAASAPLDGTAVCEPQSGVARLYVVGLRDGRAVEDLNFDGSLTTPDRYQIVGSTIFDTPTPFYAPDGTVSLILQSGQSLPTPVSINRRVRTYWFQESF